MKKKITYFVCSNSMVRCMFKADNARNNEKLCQKEGKCAHKEKKHYIQKSEEENG